MNRILFVFLLISVTTNSFAGNKPPAKVAKLINQFESLNDKCRGGSGDKPETWKACDKRDALYPKINSLGWCFGHNEQTESDKVWEKCRK